MKKRFLSILLCLCMALTLLPTAALAADKGTADSIAAGLAIEGLTKDDTFTVDDVTFTYGGDVSSAGLNLDSTHGDTLPTVETIYKAGSGYALFSPTPATLTLNNATIEGAASDSNSYGIRITDNLTIALVGVSTVTGGTSSGNLSNGIFCSGGSSITISGDGTLTATGGTVNESGGCSYGIYSGGSNSSGGRGSVTIQGNATVTATGGTASGSGGGSYGIYSYNASVTISDNAIVTATGGTASATYGYSYGFYSYNGSGSASVIISGNAIVTATGGTATSGSYGIRNGSGSNSDSDSAEVTISDTASVTATGGSGTNSYGIFNGSNSDSANATVTISDTAIVIATGGTATSGSSAGIHNVSYGSANVAISGGQVTATGGSGTNSIGIYSSDSGDINYNGGLLVAKGGSSALNKEATGTSNLLAGTNDTASKFVVFGDNTYHVHTESIDNTDTDKQGVVWSGDTLTLTNTIIISTDDTPALTIPAGGKLTLESFNVVLAGDADSSSYAVKGEGALTIDGGGSLVAIGGSSGSSGSSYGICGGTSVTILGGTVTAIGGSSGSRGSSYGICGGTSVTIDGGKVAAIGGSGGSSSGIYSSSKAGGVSIYGGIVAAVGGSGSKSYGIDSSSESDGIRISGGIVSAVGSSKGIFSVTIVTVIGGIVTAIGGILGIHSGSSKITISGGSGVAIATDDAANAMSHAPSITKAMETTGAYSDKVMTWKYSPKIEVYLGGNFSDNAPVEYSSFQDGWNAAVGDENGELTTVKLLANWTAASDTTYTTSFGTGTGFEYGGILVPAEKYITLDLNGKTIDRGLTTEQENGSVIRALGALTLSDSGTGGKITGGADSTTGGGVYVEDGATFTMTGGSITGNTGDGVFVGGSFYVSGKPVVSGNTSDGGTRNVYLPTGKTITITTTGALTDGASIGVTTEATSPATVTVAKQGSIGDLEKIFSDSTSYKVEFNSSDEVIMLVPRVISGHYDPPVTTERLANADNTVWVTGKNLTAGDLLITERDPAGSAYEALLKLADSADVFATYNIYLRSGKKSTGSAMHLTFDLNAQYAGQDFTLVHNKADTTYEYFYDTADASGDLTFGPLYELSPFMLVMGTLTPFEDVSENDWFSKDVAYVFQNGMMSGVADGVFDPHGTTTRGMIATTLYRLAGEPAVSDECPFDDVETDKYYENAVIWAAENSIVDGYGDGKFGPEDTITREQLAAVLWRYAQFKGYDVSVGEDTIILSYNDALDVSEYAIPAMQWACGAGLIQGDAGNLMPQGGAERSQVAAILHRFCENMK